MKLAAISMVRDEADIIEVWARHTLFFLDRLFIIDDGSSDATASILRMLAAEGLPVELVPHHSSTSDYQGACTTQLMAHALRAAPWDFVFLLDADECPAVSSRAALELDLSCVPAAAVAGLAKLEYHLSPLDHPDDPNPLTRMQHHFPVEDAVFKVALPGPVARHPRIRVADGNHSASIADTRLPAHLLRVTRLAHFPARSREQLVAKCLSADMR
ncbi:glycosyltransferase family 2 protein [Xanthobacter sp. V4C-4]|uniref:glycosyltransferase family 2 protein n=1 Tax=Xanthobacter cornucopiae TaxID=3119924 RepID=UPI00372C24A6